MSLKERAFWSKSKLENFVWKIGQRKSFSELVCAAKSAKERKEK